MSRDLVSNVFMQVQIRAPLRDGDILMYDATLNVWFNYRLPH